MEERLDAALFFEVIEVEKMGPAAVEAGYHADIGRR